MVLTSEELRAHIEAALRALAPAPYQRVDDGDVFLSLPNPIGKSGGLELLEMDGEVELEFGQGGMSWEFFSIDEQGKDIFTDEEFKDTLKELVSVVRGILDETMFSAYYKAFLLPIGGIFPVSEFEGLRKRKGFESLSWKGTYTVRREGEAD